MGYLDGFLVTLRQHRLFGGDRVTQSYSGGRVAKKATSDDDEASGRSNAPADTPDDDKSAKPERLHGRHVLGRYEDGMEKCIGCELCAGVCPAKCIYVRGADNDPDDPTSPGERFGFVYEINYLRCIHCDLCVEACPTEAITESKLFEFSFTNRSDAIYTKTELLVGDDGKPQRMPWEDWREGEDEFTSGWMRATSPNGDATFRGQVGWSGELGYGVRAAEPADEPTIEGGEPADQMRESTDASRKPADAQREPADSVDLDSASAPDRSTDEVTAGVGSVSDQPDASEVSQQQGSAGTGTRERSEPPTRSATSRTASEASDEE